MRTRRIAATLSLLFGALLVIGVHASRLAEAAGSPPTLFDRIGIGADWGPHWATGARPQDADPRDTQADGAFPAEISRSATQASRPSGCMTRTSRPGSPCSTRWTR
jgi:hypothetical protein